MTNQDQQSLPAVLVITGPTAAGKTELVLDLAERINGEIISVDSALIYRGMDIGTAKPTLDETSRVPHHLIDIRDPSEAYSAAEFRDDALLLIKDIFRRGKRPILSGGTMLYFKALREGIADLPQTNETIREQVAQRVLNEGIEALHDYLSSFDKAMAARLKTTDRQRITRAIEVFLASGKPLSQWHREQSLQACPYPLLAFALTPIDRSVLHQRIEQRFDRMLERGLLEEVQALYSRADLNPDLPSMRCVGYRQFWQHLSGELSYEEARYRAIVATRQLAKRQYTWLRSWQGIEWLDSTDKNNSEHLVERYCQR